MERLSWKGLPAARGDYLELKLLDSTWHPQGMALVRVEEREDPARYGEWFQATIVAVSDGYLQWWLEDQMAHIGPPGVSPVLWCNHGALIMTTDSIKMNARVTFERKLL